MLFLLSSSSSLAYCLLYVVLNSSNCAAPFGLMNANVRAATDSTTTTKINGNNIIFKKCKNNVRSDNLLNYRDKKKKGSLYFWYIFVRRCSLSMLYLYWGAATFLTAFQL